jgi:hypothetical protein
LLQVAVVDPLLVLLVDHQAAAVLVEAAAQMVDLQQRILDLVVALQVLHQMVVQAVQD